MKFDHDEDYPAVMIKVCGITKCFTDMEGGSFLYFTNFAI
jgi:hypothetical protein